MQRQMSLSLAKGHSYRYILSSSPLKGTSRPLIADQCQLKIQIQPKVTPTVTIRAGFQGWAGCT